MSTTYSPQDTDTAAAASTRPTDVSVTMAATPGDGSCGIGTYTRDLLAGIDGIESEFVHIAQEDRSLGDFLSLAVQAVRGTGDVIHVQHEYGLFRRDGSKFPGVMGLVFFPLLFLFSRLRSKRVVVTMHSVLNPEPDESPFSVRLYLLLMHKLLATGTAHLIFLSPDCASKFLADVGVDDDGYSVLSHGVNTEVPGESNAAEAKRAFGFDSDDDVVAIPGFVRPPKGHDIFVELARALPEYEFMIAGGARPKGADFEFAEQIREEAPENVTVTGVLDDEAYWTALAAPDLAVLPYRVVSQSGTFNSCATRELPVLASDVDYFRRIEDEWGVPETVDVEDTEALEERVRSLLEDDARRERLAESIARYKRANSFDQVGADHRRIYHRVANGTADGLGERASETDSPRSQSLAGSCSAQSGTLSDKSVTQD
ncbi:glycosyltransferase [Halorubrum sp. AD140]|uniref:glycosyltransferase n=1 Tax=Halorubrum sp. AD140 TaxID=3050073 RepID=UPI002ACCAC48|nr:glycosyltransferase [Halorubrum sp. AD140]MDZ5812722.1 glycosyltransferase [Halorubrum sp. AD140]